MCSLEQYQEQACRYAFLSIGGNLSSPSSTLAIRNWLSWLLFAVLKQLMKAVQLPSWDKGQNSSTHKISNKRLNTYPEAQLTQKRREFMNSRKWYIHFQNPFYLLCIWGLPPRPSPAQAFLSLALGAFLSESPSHLPPSNSPLWNTEGCVVAQGLL